MTGVALGGAVSGQQVLRAATPAAGFAKQNGTPPVLSWQAPNDGVNHYVTVFYQQDVTVAETGGEIDLTVTFPDGSVNAPQLAAGGAGTGATGVAAVSRIVKPGTTVAITQGTALTLGASVLWAAIFST